MYYCTVLLRRALSGIPPSLNDRQEAVAPKMSLLIAPCCFLANEDKNIAKQLFSIFSAASQFPIDVS